MCDVLALIAYMQKHVSLVQQLLLNRVPTQYSLKCQIASELGRCHRYLARPKLEMQVYQRALQLCASGQRSADRFDTHSLWVLTNPLVLRTHMLNAVMLLPGIC